MAILVVVHICVHVCLIVTQILRCRLRVVRGQITPVIRRLPCHIARTTEHRVQGRVSYKHRLNNIVRAIYVRVTYNLKIRSGTHLHRYGGYVLEHVVCQHRLYNKHVVVRVHHLHHTQIVYVSVVVEVKVRNHVARRVQYHLKLFHRLRLRKSRSHCLKVKMQTDVGRHSVHLHCRCRRMTRCSHCRRCACRCRINHLLGCGYYRCRSRNYCGCYRLLRGG